MQLVVLVIEIYDLLFKKGKVMMHNKIVTLHKRYTMLHEHYPDGFRDYPV
jgi:hypothetical protein